MKSHHPSRRHFLRSSGMILIGFTLLSKCGASIEEPMPGFMLDELPGGLEDSPRINAWLEILENGRIRVLTGKIELGQGIRVAVQQVAADELNTRPGLIDVHLAGIAGVCYYIVSKVGLRTTGHGKGIIHKPERHQDEYQDATMFRPLFFLHHHAPTSVLRILFF